MSKAKKKDTGEIIFACGRRYVEVSQSNIDQVNVGDRLRVWATEDSPQNPEPSSFEQSCLSCPCRRKAKRKEDMFYEKGDIDPKTDRACRRPSGKSFSCVIAELKPSDE